MKPYYQDGAATIYHGNCLEMLSEIGSVDLVLMDRPYGIAYRPQYGRRRLPSGRWREGDAMPPVVGDQAPFDPRPFLALGPCITWGANHYASRLPDVGRWLVWDKRENIIPERTQSDCELAFDTTKGAARIFRHYWDGMVKKSERGERREHPTQKPVALMAWCLGFYPDAQIILDPFMGSGPVLRAAKDLRRRAIGIEIEERYCEVAARRLSQDVLPL